MAAEISEELLQAADQYMLEPLKRLCEAAIAASLSTDNLASVYDLSENFNAPQLGRHCMLYALEHYEELVRPGIDSLVILTACTYCTLPVQELRATSCSLAWPSLLSPPCHYECSIPA